MIPTSGASLTGSRLLRSRLLHEQRGDRALFAERGNAHGFEGGFIAGGGDIAKDGLFKRHEIGHGDGHLLVNARGSPANETVIIRESG